MAPSEDSGQGFALCQAGSLNSGGCGQLRDLSHWEDDIYLLLTHQLQDRLCSLCSAPVLAGKGWFVGSRLG